MVDHPCLGDIEFPSFWGPLGVVHGDFKPFKRMLLKHVVADFIEDAGRWLSKTARLWARAIRGTERR